jgi:hypothetical protein
MWENQMRGLEILGMKPGKTKNGTNTKSKWDFPGRWITM